jgi:hypothetical protein
MRLGAPRPTAVLRMKFDEVTREPTPVFERSGVIEATLSVDDTRCL